MTEYPTGTVGEVATVAVNTIPPITGKQKLGVKVAKVPALILQIGLIPASISLLLRAGSPTGLVASIVIIPVFPVAGLASESVEGVPAPVPEKVVPAGLSNITIY